MPEVLQGIRHTQTWGLNWWQGLTLGTQRQTLLGGGWGGGFAANSAQREDRAGANVEVEAAPKKARQPAGQVWSPLEDSLPKFGPCRIRDIRPPVPIAWSVELLATRVDGTPVTLASCLACRAFERSLVNRPRHPGLP